MHSRKKLVTVRSHQLCSLNHGGFDGGSGGNFHAQRRTIRPKAPSVDPGSVMYVVMTSERVSCATIPLRTRPALSSHRLQSELLRRRFWWENDCVVDSISCRGSVVFRRMISVILGTRSWPLEIPRRNIFCTSCAVYRPSVSVGPYHFLFVCLTLCASLLCSTPSPPNVRLLSNSKSMALAVRSSVTSTRCTVSCRMPRASPRSTTLVPRTRTTSW